MIDTLLSHRSKAEESSILEEFGAEKGGYTLLTLHRPANVDSAGTLTGLLDAVQELSQVCPVIFPCHPRTLAVIEKHRLLGRLDQEGALKRGRIRACAPLGYLDFIKLVGNSRLVLTDSGGLQEETTILGVPCLTLRENTERPVTVTHGTNEIVGVRRDRIVESGLKKLSVHAEISKTLPPLWDGRASERIVGHLASALA
jgi:UDP-N-acetylglucosamine 2-epimerase (non-hydrolysing)